MPEHHSPETGSLDLDRAFDSLTRDLAARPGAPGATSAVATARRRRRTTLASVGAVAVLTVGAVSLPQLTSGGDPDRPGDVASSGGPLVFSGAALTDATDGWTGPWREPTSGDELEDVEFGEPQCLDELPDAGTNVEPSRVGDVILLSNESRTGAYVSFAEFASADDVAPILETFSAASVEETCGVRTEAIAVDRTEVRHAHVDAAGKEPATDWWLAVEGARLAMLVVVAPEGGAPDEVQVDVASLLERALDADENFVNSMTRVESGSGSGSSSSGTVGRGEVPTYPTLDRPAIMEVTDGWPAEITATGRLSCADQLSLSGMQWQSMSSDDGGLTTTHTGFDDAAAAQAAVDQVAAQLRSCQSTRWDVTTGTLDDGRRTLSAGSEQGTVVLAQRGATLAWITIGAPDAPAPAVQAIASLLHDTLRVGDEARKD